MDGFPGRPLFHQAEKLLRGKPRQGRVFRPRHLTPVHLHLLRPSTVNLLPLLADGLGARHGVADQALRCGGDAQLLDGVRGPDAVLPGQLCHALQREGALRRYDGLLRHLRRRRGARLDQALHVESVGQALRCLETDQPHVPHVSDCVAGVKGRVHGGGQRLPPARGRVENGDELLLHPGLELVHHVPRLVDRERLAGKLLCELREPEVVHGHEAGRGDAHVNGDVARGRVHHRLLRDVADDLGPHLTHLVEKLRHAEHAIPGQHALRFQVQQVDGWAQPLAHGLQQGAEAALQAVGVAGHLEDFLAGESGDDLLRTRVPSEVPVRDVVALRGLEDAGLLQFAGEGAQGLAAGDGNRQEVRRIVDLPQQVDNRLHALLYQSDLLRAHVGEARVSLHGLHDLLRRVHHGGGHHVLLRGADRLADEVQGVLDVADVPRKRGVRPAMNLPHLRVHVEAGRDLRQADLRLRREQPRLQRDATLAAGGGFQGLAKEGLAEWLRQARARADDVCGGPRRRRRRERVLERRQPRPLERAGGDEGLPHELQAAAVSADLGQRFGGILRGGGAPHGGGAFRGQGVGGQGTRAGLGETHGGPAAGERGLTGARRATVPRGQVHQRVESDVHAEGEGAAEPRMVCILGDRVLEGKTRQGGTAREPQAVRRILQALQDARHGPLLRLLGVRVCPRAQPAHNPVQRPAEDVAEALQERELLLGTLGLRRVTHALQAALQASDLAIQLPGVATAAAASSAAHESGRHQRAFLDQRLKSGSGSEGVGIPDTLGNLGTLMGFGVGSVGPMLRGARARCWAPCIN